MRSRSGVLEKYLVDEPLECLGGVAQSKWHPQNLKETEGSDDHGFGNICWLNWYLMVRLYHLEKILQSWSVAVKSCV